MTTILVVGQTPPPLHGQAIMIEHMLRGDYGAIRLHHVRMGFSGEIGEVGKLRLHKAVELLRVIARILAGRVVHGARILYYPPAGPDIIPVVRDIAILICTRWAFQRTIFHFHAGGLSDLYPGLGRIGRFLFRAAYWRPDLAIRLSDLAPEDGQRLGAKKQWTIPYGIEDLARECPQKEPSDAAEPHILFMGILCESKGVLILLDACRILREKGISFHVTLAGAFESAQFERTVREHLRSHDLTDAVTLAGVLAGDEKCRAFSQAAIFCFPSYYEAETFGLVLVEALCFGLPVVATRWRGIPDIVEDSVCGFLVPARDAEPVAAKLELLIRDPSLRQRMGEQGRRRYLERFTLEQYHARLRLALQEVVTDTAAHSPAGPTSTP